MKAINCTPHDITLVADGASMKLVPSGINPRVDQIRTNVDTIIIDGVAFPVSRSVFGSVVGLPDPVDGTVYIVSMLVAQAAAGRTDLLAVDQTIRDDAGRIVGAKGFAVP